MEYEFPDGFSVVAQDLVEKLLVLDPEQRLGCEEMGGFEKLKSHPFMRELTLNIFTSKNPLPSFPFFLLPLQTQKISGAITGSLGLMMQEWWK